MVDSMDTTPQQAESDFNAAFSKELPTTLPQAAPQAPEPGGPVNVINPEGKVVSIDHSQLHGALEAGYQPATPDQVGNHFLQEKYGSAGQQAIAGLEGAASAATFGLSTGLETMAGVNPEDIQARRAANPGAHGAGQVAGLVGTALIPGLGEANAAKVMETAGVAGAKALGLGASEAVANKIGSAAVRGAIENTLFQAGDETSKYLSRDPSINVQSAAAEVGLAGLIGGGIGGGLGTVAPLWKATFGKQTGGMLNAIADRLGGVEGQEATSPIEQIASKAGLDLTPEIRGALSDDVHLQQIARTLSQSDTTGAGKSFQESLKTFHNAASDSIGTALGKAPAELEKMPELSKYESGKSLGQTLASEYHSQMEPIAQEFDKLRDKYSGLKLDASITEKAAEFEKAQKKAVSELGRITRETQEAMKSGSPEKAVAASAKLEEAQNKLKELSAQGKAAGTIDTVATKIQELVQKEGWNASPSSDIMKEVNRVLKELPHQKTLKNLQDYATAVGNNMQADPMNGPLRRAGGMIKSILRDAEAETIAGEIGRREGAEALGRYSAVRRAYADQAATMEELDSRLHLRGRPSSYAKALKEAATTDGETLLRRLSGAGDADLLTVLESKFPQTAAKLKQYHVDNLLHTGVSKAKPGESINASAVRSALDKMSPELRQFAVSKEAQAKIDAVSQLLDKMKDSKYNFSNTARTVDSLTSHVPGGIVGLVGALASPHVGLAMLAGGATKYLTKDTPDAVRLGLLKFLGSNKPIEPGAFKATVDALRATIRGENAISKASKNVFKATEKSVISASVSTGDREKLNKMVIAAQKDPSILSGVGSDAGHYMPEHAQEIAATSVNALNYLNSLRPDTTPKAPLDSKLPPDPGKLAAYNRALDIANKPLIILDKIKSGSVTPGEINAVKAMYPALYNNLVQKLTTDMTDHLAKDGIVPYRTRIGLSLFGGMPMDSTLTGAAIVAAQPKVVQPEQPNQGGPSKPPSAASTKGIAKLPSSYQTADQARAQRSQKD